ncbi:MAG: KOW motif-containing protein [Deltaproteobacteria bacterium]|nr:KOW motif-containing protein [Deltaproteobacteria bacterium]
MPFQGFTPADFDAFLERKWRSNVFNLERLQVKQKLLGLGRDLNPLMVAPDGSLLECETSAEHPALWNQHRVENQYLFFSRNKEARCELDRIIDRQRTIASLIEDPSPLRNHIFLSLMVDAKGLEVALKLHADAAVDRENLQRKTQDFFVREKLLSLLRGLPEEFALGIDGRASIATAELGDEALQELIRELPATHSWVAVGRRFSREDPTLAEPTFATVSARLLGALLPVLHYVAWSRDNDFVSMRKTLQEEAVRTKSKGLSKHDHVRVVRGVFAGKTGTVQEVDGKGSLRVLLGTMVIKLDGEDVAKV